MSRTAWYWIIGILVVVAIAWLVLANSTNTAAQPDTNTPTTTIQEASTTPAGTSTVSA